MTTPSSAQTMENPSTALGEMTCWRGAGGNDRLIGGDGSDTFIFKPGDGRDSIIDFDALEGDKISLSGFGFTDIRDVKMTSSQGNTTISFGKGDSILLFGVDGTTLTNGDFIFS